MPAPIGEGVPQRGDRSARNTHEYADLHASDIEEEEYTYHNPWPMEAGDAAVSDGNKLVATNIATQAELDAHTEDTSNPHEVAHDQLGGVTADQHHDQAHTLGSADDHSDVDISTPPEVGQALVWDGARWIPGDAGGGAGGGAGAAGYAETIGDGVETQYTVEHSLDTLDVLVQVYDLTTTPIEKVEPHIQVIDENTVQVTFLDEPAEDQYRVMVVPVGEDSGGGGAFTGLTDTPASYAGQGGKYVAVKATEDGLEFL